MNDIAIIALIVILFILAMIGIPYLLMKRAVNHVLKIFQRNSAIDVKSAKTIDELGLRPRTIMQGMFRTRDYKPRALNALMKAEIVRMTEGGKLYLSEDKLATAKRYKR